jgi:hypothetical protein
MTLPGTSRKVYGSDSASIAFTHAKYGEVAGPLGLWAPTPIIKQIRCQRQ